MIYDQEGGGTDWTFRRDSAEIAVTLKGRLRVSAAEGVRAAVLADAGVAIVSEWMFAPEIADKTVKVVLQDWELPRIDLWAVFPAGRTATNKAHTFTQARPRGDARPERGRECGQILIYCQCLKVAHRDQFHLQDLRSAFGEKRNWVGRQSSPPQSKK